MIDKISTDNCVLCKACSNSCPVDAISFTHKQFDFLYPTINFEKCIKCNKCESACPLLNIKSAESKKIAFAGKNSDNNIRLSSTSGGAFDSIANYVLDKNGYICGAVFEDDFTVKHIVSNKYDDIKKMRGSKYSQSDINTVYKEIQTLLNDDRYVLFSGCPCQVAGLKAFLQKDYDSLITVDFICHGIPSANMLKSYIKLMEDKHNSKVKQINFRNKSKGWHSSSVKIEFENGKVYTNPITVDAYMNGFLGNTTLKESCYTCSFRDFKSGSDITLGDFWGAETELNNIDDNKGISAIIANTEKGLDLLNNTNLSLSECSVDTIIKYNKNIIESPKPNPIREKFYDYAELNGFDNAIKKYLQETPTEKLKRKIRLFLRSVKHILKGNGKPLY